MNVLSKTYSRKSMLCAIAMLCAPKGLFANISPFVSKFLSKIDSNNVVYIMEHYDKNGIDVQSKDDKDLATSSLCHSVTSGGSLKMLITQLNGKVLNLCAGLVPFAEEIDLSSIDVKIKCIGIPGTCIFDGQGSTRIFNVVSGADSSNDFEMVGISFINSRVSVTTNLAVGGAIKLENYNSFFEYCFFYNNKVVTTASYGVSSGGAVYSVKSDNTHTFQNSLFVDNRSISENIRYGGALYIEGSDLRVVSTDFIANSGYSSPDEEGGDGFGYGGAIYFYDAHLDISLSLFKLNGAKNSTGGALYIYYADSGSVIENSVFSSNFAKNDGAAYIEYSCLNWQDNAKLSANSASEQCPGIRHYNEDVCFDVEQNFIISSYCE